MTFVAEQGLLDPEGYYALLGVEPGADLAAIKRGYRDQARHWHTDVNHTNEAAARMRAINDAFTHVGDPIRRREYDERARAGRQSLRLSRSMVDFGAHEAGQFRPAHFKVFSDDPVESLNISANRGTWWTADIEFFGHESHQLNIMVVAHPHSPGVYLDTITLSTKNGSVTVTLKAEVLDGQSTPPTDTQDDSASTSANASGTTPGMAHPSCDPDAWSPAFTKFARWGMSGFTPIVLYAATSGLRKALVDWPLWSQQTISTMAALSAVCFLTYLVTATSWLSRGTTPFKYSVVIFSTIGCIGILVSIAVLMFAALVVVIILAVIGAVLSG